MIGHKLEAFIFGRNLLYFLRIAFQNTLLNVFQLMDRLAFIDSNLLKNS